MLPEAVGREVLRQRLASRLFAGALVVMIYGFLTDAIRAALFPEADHAVFVVPYMLALLGLGAVAFVRSHLSGAIWVFALSGLALIVLSASYEYTYGWDVVFDGKKPFFIFPCFVIGFFVFRQGLNLDRLFRWLVGFLLFHNVWVFLEFLSYSDRASFLATIFDTNIYRTDLTWFYDWSVNGPVLGPQHANILALISGFVFLAWKPASPGVRRLALALAAFDFVVTLSTTGMVALMVCLGLWLSLRADTLSRWGAAFVFGLALWLAFNFEYLLYLKQGTEAFINKYSYSDSWTTQAQNVMSQVMDVRLFGTLDYAPENADVYYLSLLGRSGPLVFAWLMSFMAWALYRGAVRYRREADPRIGVFLLAATAIVVSGIHYSTIINEGATMMLGLSFAASGDAASARKALTLRAAAPPRRRRVFTGVGGRVASVGKPHCVPQAQ